MTRARTKSSVVPDSNSSHPAQQRIQPVKKRSYTSTSVHYQPTTTRYHSSSVLSSHFPPLTSESTEEHNLLHHSSLAFAESPPSSSHHLHSNISNSNLLQRRLSTTELSSDHKSHSQPLLRRAHSPLPKSANNTTHFHQRATPNQYSIIVSNNTNASSNHEKLDLYSKYIQKLRLELNKKSQLIKDLKEYIRKQDESIRISHDMYQKVLKHRCHGGSRPSLEPSQEFLRELSQTPWENSNFNGDDELTDELFEDDFSEELLDEMKSRLMKYETRPHVAFSSETTTSNISRTTSNASTQTFFENDETDKKMLLESINALKEVALSKQVKELKDQLHQSKTMYEALKDELTSTRSEFIQYKMRLEEDREKHLKEIRNLSETCKFEKNTKADIYQSISNHYEEENKKNFNIIDKLKIDLKNRDTEKSSLEKLIETQQSLYNNLNDRYSKETHQLKKEIEALRKKLSISMTRNNLDFNSSFNADSKTTFGSTTSDISSILQPSDTAQYMKSSRSSHDQAKSHRNGLPKI
ncbi:hypothetical protein C9374_000869 [Naegleria lovaniensis]|uniref:Uncharacterized protein n=1 Tax=Naegleria lovaniensis TaxID=51637 RepID=A0AA88GXN8_NAELO|nr:uncharacterized protein C9374_000869 [Naegleria lovaniensis]KAG2388019.1 hypothetical protein C9374_000869 [Naegleria lovaniensis]